MGAKGMNDDAFLYTYRRPPDPRFAAALYRRISTEPGVTITFSFAPLAQLKRGLNIVGTALAVLVAFSPDVRSRLWEQIINILLIDKEVTQWSTD
jgi:hypothetical protein